MKSSKKALGKGRRLKKKSQKGIEHYIHLKWTSLIFCCPLINGLRLPIGARDDLKCTTSNGRPHSAAVFS